MMAASLPTSVSTARRAVLHCGRRAGHAPRDRPDRRLQPLPMLRYPGGDEFAPPPRGDEPIATGWDQISFLAAGRSTILLGPDVASSSILVHGRRIDDIAPGRRRRVAGWPFDWSEAAPDGRRCRFYKSIAALATGGIAIERDVRRSMARSGPSEAGSMRTRSSRRTSSSDADLPTHGSLRRGRLAPVAGALRSRRPASFTRSSIRFLSGRPTLSGRNFVLAVMPRSVRARREHRRVASTSDRSRGPMRPPRSALPMMCCCDLLGRGGVGRRHDVAAAWRCPTVAMAG